MEHLKMSWWAAVPPICLGLFASPYLKTVVEYEATSEYPFSLWDSMVLCIVFAALSYFLGMALRPLAIKERLEDRIEAVSEYFDEEEKRTGQK